MHRICPSIMVVPFKHPHTNMYMVYSISAMSVTGVSTAIVENVVQTCLAQSSSIPTRSSANATNHKLFTELRVGIEETLLLANRYSL